MATGEVDGGFFMNCKIYREGEYLGEAEVELPELIFTPKENPADLNSKNCAALIMTSVGGLRSRG
jgi:hypothetical protein